MCKLICEKRGRRVSWTDSVDVWSCTEFGACTAEDAGLTLGGVPLAVCTGCTLHRPAGPPRRGTVGDRLRDVLTEIGIKRPGCGTCGTLQKMLNDWGIEGCERNRAWILAELRHQRKTATWREVWRAVRKLYFSEAAVLNEALRRSKLDPE